MKASDMTTIALNKSLHGVYQTIYQAADRGLFSVYVPESKEVKDSLLRDGFELESFNDGFFVHWDPESIRRNRTRRWVTFIVIVFGIVLPLLFFLSSGVAPA